MKTGPNLYFFQDGGRYYHTETSPLICSANQWTGFYMITGLRHERVKLVRLRLLQFHEIISCNKLTISNVC